MTAQCPTKMAPTLSPLSSESDIEVIQLEEIPVSPITFKTGGTSQSLREEEYDDDDNGEGDSGERALLVENMQTRWRGEKASNVIAFWRQTSGIVIEVRASSLQSRVIDPATLDTAHTPFHHTRQPLHRGTVSKNICMTFPGPSA
jgi:hypothetical protein